MTIYVFTGPSLSPEDGRPELDAEFLPPVAEGDVYRVALKKPRAIGIIDGYFENVPSVWHKEILWAMSEGVHVYGSASMGALRAAELEPFGMVGVGAVFEAFHEGWLEDDDEVAVIHGPAELDYPALSEAMVNIRRTFDDAAAQGIIGGETCAALIAIAKSMHYRDRAYPPILQRARAEDLPGIEIDALLHWLPGGKVNQKRDDALQMLRVMRDELAAGAGPKEVAYTFEHTTKWQAAAKLALEPVPAGE